MRYKLTFVLLIWSLFAWGAQDEPSSFYNSIDDDNIHEKARLRQYPGGADEENLEVQSEVTEPYSLDSEKAIQQGVYESFVKKKNSKEVSKTE